MSGVIDKEIQLSLYEAQIQSEFFLTNLHSHTISSMLYRDPTQFTYGGQIRIPTIGNGTITTWNPNEDTIVPTAIPTGEVTFQITDNPAAGWSYREQQRQELGDMWVDNFLAHHNAEFLRNYKERTERRMFETIVAAQAENDNNEVNLHSHRFVASGGTDAARTLSVRDLQEMRTSFIKANAPNALVLFIDSVAEEQLMKEYTGVMTNDANPTIQNLLKDGSFTNDHRYLGNMYGWNTFVTNNLPHVNDTTITHRGTARAISGGTKLPAVFLSIENDNTKALLYQERIAPNVKGEFRAMQREWAYGAVAQQGFGIQRTDTVGVVVHHDLPA